MNKKPISDFKKNNPLNTAVLFLIFNRMNTAVQVFEMIRQARPPRLYIASDGARNNNKDESIAVELVRQYVLEHIDWNCEIKTLFRDTNLGCKYAVSDAITWFFTHEEMGIILEDDCLPSQSFFWFCQQLLEKYHNDSRIFLITGYNKCNEWKRNENDCFFSMLGGIWGWATWRRCWQHYNVQMKDIDCFIRDRGFQNSLGLKMGNKREKIIYNSIIKEKVDTWDYQWAYTRHKNYALSCIPCVNLIENIGFGANATHTKGPNQDEVQRNEILFPIQTSSFIFPDREYDELLISNVSLLHRIKTKVKKWFLRNE